MTEPLETAGAAAFKDRSVGLVLFGVLEIFLGCICALMVPLVLLSAVAGQAGPAPASLKTMIPAVALYLLLAVAFIWLGIGSILARRWARALMLVCSWLWLIGGTLGTICLAVVMPGILERALQQAPQGQQIPPVVLHITFAVMGGFAGCVYIILPGILVLFYRSQHVKATCERKDPRVRWTDKCPLPVLALSIMLAFGAYSMIWLPAFNGVFPFFGTLISGLPGAVVVLLLVALLGYLAWGTYKLQMAAWWGVFALMAVWTISAVMTFSRVGLLEMYEKMGLSEQQLQLIRETGMLEGMPVAWWTGICCAAYLGYLLYVLRYFLAARKQQVL